MHLGIPYGGDRNTDREEDTGFRPVFQFGKGGRQVGQQDLAHLPRFPVRPTPLRVRHRCALASSSL
jgi:hypothetical protein